MRISASLLRQTLPPIIGVIDGTVEWIFAFPDRLSVTISGADRLLDETREKLAAPSGARWQTSPACPPIAALADRAGARATFAATPEQNASGPAALRNWRNLFLAGDWTDTGLARDHRRCDPVRQPRRRIWRWQGNLRNAHERCPTLHKPSVDRR